MAQPLPPLAPRTAIGLNEKLSRRRQPKSRNGCITCKARRMKCDESKPSCQQCTRRGVACGGYPKFLRWRSVAQNTDDSVTHLPQFQSTLTKNQLTNEVGDPDSQNGRQMRLEPSRKQTDEISDSQSRPSPWQSSETQPFMTENASANSIELAHEEGGDGCDVGEGGMAVSQMDSQPPSLTALIDSVFSNSPMSIDFGRFLLTHEHDENQFQLSSVGMPVPQEHYASMEFDGGDWNMYGLEELLRGTGGEWEPDNGSSVLQQPLPEADSELPHLSLAAPSDSASGNNTLPSMLKLQATQEAIQQLFENRTCEFLSIKEDQTRNPWRTLIWPLAANCPALYHALAAMACLHICKLQPRLRLPGLQHFESSVEALASGNLTLEATIATRLALALAASWDYEKSPTVIEHTNAARTLVRQAGSKEHASKLATVELSRLSFLANTCLYMDVIARLVCVEPLSLNDLDFMTACSTLSSSIPSKQQLDPLMGCAITLFPMIGQLAELIGRVRKRPQKRNSPAIISRAIELRISIERWAPSIDTGVSVELNSSLSDSIQTAEAYRWASLLLLRQAVPELPWKNSIWELASKSLIFIATIPLSSRTTIVQIFPLMLAGCEATEDDDREWVRERWDLMSKNMISGIVDRCKEITTEVWRRRDEFGIFNGFPPNSQQSPPLTEIWGAVKGGVTVEDAAPEFGAQTTDSFEKEVHQHSDSLGFPESAAFKKDIDPVTRAGHLHYTVRGNLHCFGVMKDRDWYVFLG